MLDRPRPADWIVPLVLAVVLGTGFYVAQNLPLPNEIAAGSGQLCTGGLFGICILVAFIQGLRWAASEWVNVYERRQEARSITPLRRAAEAMRQLTEEQAELIPRFMPNDAQVVFVEQEQELVAHYYTPEGLIPWDWIEKFLVSSNNVYLMPVNNTSDKTPERTFAQAMTAALIRKGWAVPAVGPHPAMWKPGGREQASRFFQVKLRNGVGYMEPEESEGKQDG